MTKTKAQARSERAFNAYCALGHHGKRSIDLLIENWQQYGKGKPPGYRTLARWSTDYHWVRRVNEYDIEMAEMERQRQLETELADREKRRGRRLQDAELVRETCRAILYDKQGNRLREVAYDGRVRRGRATVRAIEVAYNGLSKAGAEERLDSGEATERTDLTTGGMPFVYEYVGVDPDLI